MSSMRIVGFITMIGLGLSPAGAKAGSFKCHFKDQPEMIISLDYPEAHVKLMASTIRFKIRLCPL